MKPCDCPNCRGWEGWARSGWTYCPGCGIFAYGIVGLCGECRKAQDLDIPRTA